MHFVVMESVFNTKLKLHTIYDLKGSTVNRQATQKEKEKGERNTGKEERAKAPNLALAAAGTVTGRILRQIAPPRRAKEKPKAKGAGKEKEETSQRSK